MNKLKSSVNWLSSSVFVKFFNIISFISLYSFNTFIKTNSSWLITESIKALEIKTSMLFKLDVVNNTLFYLVSFSCFLL